MCVRARRDPPCAPALTRHSPSAQPGYRHHAAIPEAARLDYVRRPESQVTKTAAKAGKSDKDLTGGAKIMKELKSKRVVKERFSAHKVSVEVRDYALRDSVGAALTRALARAGARPGDARLNGRPDARRTLDQAGVLAIDASQHDVAEAYPSAATRPAAPHVL